MTHGPGLLTVSTTIHSTILRVSADQSKQKGICRRILGQLQHDRVHRAAKDWGQGRQKVSGKRPPLSLTLLRRVVAESQPPEYELSTAACSTRDFKGGTDAQSRTWWTRVSMERHCILLGAVLVTVPGDSNSQRQHLREHSSPTPQLARSLHTVTGRQLHKQCGL